MNKYPVIGSDQLKLGYEGAIDNALRFFGAATSLCSDYPDKALALAQIGQEEIGKSLTLLAAFYLPSDIAAWQWFWKDWTAHQVKAHRAFIYELISPMRLEMQSPSGIKYSGLPLRAKIHQEKEAGLYVDFDVQNIRFICPVDTVTSFEALARTSTLSYLGATADALRRALFNSEEDFRLSAFSEIAYRICSEKIYQQDMPKILDEFSARSGQHTKLISDLNTALEANKNFFTGTLANIKQT
jgi:AbiV family abortive infection protein